MKEYTTLEVLENLKNGDIYQYDDVQMKYVNDVLYYKNMGTNEISPMGFTKDIIQK